jgi:hypothetical protein
LLTSWVQIYDARPYSTSLARRPSASSLNGSRQATGPKSLPAPRACGYRRPPAPVGQEVAALHVADRRFVRRRPAGCPSSMPRRI